MAPKKKGDDPDEKSRIAIVNAEKCKPSKCRQECKKSCPVVKMGKFCIEVTPKDKLAFISEELCIGCNICVKKCPFEAVDIINLPKMLASNTTHRYSANSFIPYYAQRLSWTSVGGEAKGILKQINKARCGRLRRRIVRRAA